MILITPKETSSPLNADIERLQTNLRGFARDIENLQERVQSGTSQMPRRVRFLATCALS